jgi:HEPN domain-containing protein
MRRSRQGSGWTSSSPLDQFYLPARYPNTLPGGIPAHAFVRPDAERALELAREVSRS